MYKLKLASRYLFRRPISYLALSAVSLCVFIVVVVMMVMTGLVGDFSRNNHRFVGDCVVGSSSLVGFGYYEDFVDELEKQDFIDAVSDVIKGYVLVNRAGSERNFGLEMIGIDAARHSSVTGFGQSLYYRRNEVSKAFSPVYEPNLAGFVIGIDRWIERDSRGNYYHQSRPSRTELVVSSFPLTATGALARAGMDIAAQKTFYFSDTSYSGLARVDSSVIYLPFEWAQQLCGMAGQVKRVSDIYIKFKQDVTLERGCAQVQALWQQYKKSRQGLMYSDLLDNVRVESWKENRREFIAAMEKEQLLLTIMFLLVGLTTVFIVFVVFYMIVSHKSKDIGILKSIGASAGDVFRIFGLFAFFVGVMGSFLGSILGWIFLSKINAIELFLFEKFGFQLWDRAIYSIAQIPNRLDVEVLMVIIACAVGACLLGALIPAHKAAKCEIIRAIQVSQL
jgi:ABC-type lipoprotein release transport system permease subunit